MQHPAIPMVPMRLSPHIINDGRSHQMQHVLGTPMGALVIIPFVYTSMMVREAIVFAASPMHMQQPQR